MTLTLTRLTRHHQLCASTVPAMDEETVTSLYTTDYSIYNNDAAPQPVAAPVAKKVHQPPSLPAVTAPPAPVRPNKTTTHSSKTTTALCIKQAPPPPQRQKTTKVAKETPKAAGVVVATTTDTTAPTNKTLKNKKHNEETPANGKDGEVTKKKKKTNKEQASPIPTAPIPTMAAPSNKKRGGRNFHQPDDDEAACAQPLKPKRPFVYHRAASNPAIRFAPSVAARRQADSPPPRVTASGHRQAPSPPGENSKQSYSSLGTASTTSTMTTQRTTNGYIVNATTNKKTMEKYRNLMTKPERSAFQPLLRQQYYPSTHANTMLMMMGGDMGNNDDPASTPKFNNRSKLCFRPADDVMPTNSTFCQTPPAQLASLRLSSVTPNKIDLPPSPDAPCSISLHGYGSSDEEDFESDDDESDSHYVDDDEEDNTTISSNECDSLC